MRGWRWFGRAQRLHHRGETLAAVEWYRKAASATLDAPVLLHQAVALAELGNERAAAEAIAHAVQLRPDDPPCRAIQAILLADSGDVARAAEAAGAARRMAPGHPIVHAAELYLRLLRGQHEALRELAERTVADSLLARARLLLAIEQIILRRETPGQRPEATADSVPDAPASKPLPPSPSKRIIDWLLGRSPRQRAHRALRRGIRCFENGDSPKAVGLLEHAARTDPRLREARRYLGCALFDVEDYARASAVLQPFVDEERDDGLAAFYYGAACCKLHRFDDANAALEAVARGQSSYDFQEWLHYFQGVAFLGVGNVARARREFAVVSDFSWSFLQERAHAALQILCCPAEHAKSDSCPDS